MLAMIVVGCVGVMDAMFATIVRSRPCGDGSSAWTALASRRDPGRRPGPTPTSSTVPSCQTGEPQPSFASTSGRPGRCAARPWQRRRRDPAAARPVRAQPGVLRRRPVLRPQIVAFAVVIALGRPPSRRRLVALASAIHPEGRGGRCSPCRPASSGRALGPSSAERRGRVRRSWPRRGRRRGRCRPRDDTTRAAGCSASYLAVAGRLLPRPVPRPSPAADLIWATGRRSWARSTCPRRRGRRVDRARRVPGGDDHARRRDRQRGPLSGLRRPGLGEHWYRNASSPHNIHPSGGAGAARPGAQRGATLPRYQDHPRNLFTLLGDQVPIQRYESVTDLCPPSLCEPPPRQPLSQALEDAAVVYGHRVLPAAARRSAGHRQSWGEFGAEDDVGSSRRRRPGQELVTWPTKWRELGADEKSPLGQAGILRERSRPSAADPQLHFVHVALPHRPWTLSPSGRTSSFSPRADQGPGAPG